MTDQDWSVPETQVWNVIRTLLDGDRPAMLATVIGVEGSAYRRPGAKMVVEEGGSGVGAITAGCLEDEVLEIAAEVLESGEARIETYDLMEDDNDVWGLGVGCNGIIDILLEPLDASFRPAVEALDGGERVGVVTVIAGDGVSLGSRAVYRPDSGVETVSGEIPPWLVEAIEEPAAALTERGKADSITIDTPDGTAEVFIDGLEPLPELVVVGSGHDVAPVVEFGRKSDFRVTVIGYRGAADLATRFPHADEVIATSPAKLGEAHEFGPNSHVVIMTHNFIDDRLSLEALIETEAPYIGLMGPQERFEEMLEEFEAEGRTFSREELEPVYTPIGLDLGGASPYQIALSIVAEIIAVQNGREPQHLRDRKGRIHDRIEIEAAAADPTD